MSETPPAWVLALRLRLKSATPTGLTVKGQNLNGKVVVSWKPPGGIKSKSITLPGLTWAASESSSIQKAVTEIAAGLEAGRPFALPPGINRVTGGPLWEPIAEQFKAHKIGDGHVSEKTWQRMYESEIKNLVAQAPLCTNSTGLIRALTQDDKPGSRGRQQKVQHVCQLLRWAIAENLLPTLWAPPSDLKNLIGQRLTPKAPAHPLKDEELLKLVDSIEHCRWRFAIQLLGGFGLRPVELLQLRPQAAGRVQCDYRKRTARGSTQPRIISPLLPFGAIGDWLELADRLKTEKLPQMGESRGIAENVNQFLSRRTVWQELKTAALAEGRRLTPYSFRHSYALRAHQLFGLSPRISASLMGHSLSTHTRFYGSWTDAQTVQRAVADGYKKASALNHG